MNDKIDFPEVLQSFKALYHLAGRTDQCPEIEVLIDQAYGQLDTRTAAALAPHISQCLSCGMALLKLEADRHQWELAMAGSPDHALAKALGPTGRKAVERITAGTPQWQTLATKATESISTWVSELWMPLWAGQAVTAAAVPEQDQYFDLGDGEYVKLNCSWEGSQTGKPPRVDLSWSANIYSPARLWVHFHDPESDERLGAVLLGTDLAGRLSVSLPELDFDPTSRKWGMKIVIEPEE